MQLEDFENFGRDSVLIRGQELIRGLQEAVSETLFSQLPIRCKIFVTQESFNAAANFT